MKSNAWTGAATAAGFRRKSRMKMKICEAIIRGTIMVGRKLSGKCSIGASEFGFAITRAAAVLTTRRISMSPAAFQAKRAFRDWAAEGSARRAPALAATDISPQPAGIANSPGKSP